MGMRLATRPLHGAGQGLRLRRVNTEVWKTHGKPPLTKIVATIGPASEHMPTLQQCARARHPASQCECACECACPEPGC